MNNTNKIVACENCAPLNCIREINNTKVDYTQDIDIVIPTENLIEYNDVYMKTSGYLWKYKRDTPALDNNKNIIEFTNSNNI